MVSIILIIFGFEKLFYPKIFRQYKSWEIFGNKEEQSKLELFLERTSGLIILIGGVIIFIHFFRVNK